MSQKGNIFNCEFSPCPSITPKPSDITTTWKMFSSPEYTFKYPSNGAVIDQTSGVYISANTKPYFTFVVKIEDNLRENKNGEVVGIKLLSFDEGYPQKFGQVIEARGNKIYKLKKVDFTLK